MQPGYELLGRLAQQRDEAAIAQFQQDWQEVKKGQKSRGAPSRG